VNESLKVIFRKPFDQQGVGSFLANLFTTELKEFLHKPLMLKHDEVEATLMEKVLIKMP